VSNPSGMATIERHEDHDRHDEICRWVEERDGKHAIVKGTRDSSGGGVLRIDFPGVAGEDELEHVSWDDWFEIFDPALLTRSARRATRTRRSSS